MSGPVPANLPPPLVAAIEAVNRNPGDLGALFRLGGMMHDYGEHEQAAKVRDHIVAMVTQAIGKGSPPPDQIANILQFLYQSFVKKIETEAQARACFQSWLKPVVEYGRRFRDPALPLPLWQPTGQRPWRAAFFLQAPTILGHTEAMLELLEHRPRGLAGWSDEPIVYLFTGQNPDLAQRVAALGARLVSVQSEMQTHGFYTQLQWLRRHIADNGVSHFVWVSAPPTSELSMAMQLAPVQVFWTLKFHPYQIPDIDGYITYGAWSEQTRIMHGETWQVVPFMMSKPSPPVSEAEVTATRARFAQHDILFGTLARTEKMNATPFLDAVVRILRENPKAGFLWTGREQHAGIQAHFERGGVAAQCHFIGWVSTPLYARVLDIFLESFPFGCGLTGIQGLEAGTAFLSFEAPETQYGMHFMRPLAENGAAAQEIRGLLQPTDGSGPLLYAANADAYVALAGRLAREPDFRQQVGAAGQAYYRRYLTASDRMAQRFMQVLTDMKKPGEGM